MVGEIFKLFIGAVILALGIPIGNLLAKYTQDEKEEGEKYFKILLWSGLLGGFIGAILGNDSLMFSLFFIALVTSRSLK